MPNTIIGVEDVFVSEVEKISFSGKFQQSETEDHHKSSRQNEKERFTGKKEGGSEGRVNREGEGTEGEGRKGRREKTGKK